MTDDDTPERDHDSQDDLELKDEDAERVRGGTDTPPRDPATGLPSGKRQWSPLTG